MPRGGARPGAGRKKGPAKQSDETAIEAVRGQIRGRLPDIVDGLLAQAEKGSVKAAIYLVDRIMGKPTQPVNVGGQDGNPVQVQDVTHLREQLAGRLDSIAARNGAEPVPALPDGERD